MRILHVITSLRTGGAERLMVDLLPEFNKKDDIHVELCLFDGETTPFRKEIESKGIIIHDFGKGNSVYNPANILRLSKLIKNYDVIHTHNTAPQFFAAITSLFSNKIFITTEHNTTNRRRNYRIFKAIDRWMYARYNHIICISDKANENLRNYISGINTRNISTIYNGIDTQKFQNAQPSGYLTELSSDISKKIIMIAAFRLQKDQPTLIKAMKSLPDDFHLFLVGEGPCKAECIELTSKLNLSRRVHFLGHRNDIGPLLKEADFVAMSSHYEGLSLSSVEGLAAGKPFLASDVDGLREVVINAGILFPHGDSNAFADEILKLNDSPCLYDTVSSACRKRATKYDISHMIDGYIRIYNNAF